MTRQALISTVAILTVSAGSLPTIAQSLSEADAVGIIGQKLTAENLGQVHDFSLRMSRNPEIPYTAALRGLLEVEQMTRPWDSDAPGSAGRSFEFSQDPHLQFNFSPEKLDADPRYIENLARAMRDAHDAPILRAPEEEDIQGYNWTEVIMQQAGTEAVSPLIWEELTAQETIEVERPEQHAARQTEAPEEGALGRESSASSDQQTAAQTLEEMTEPEGTQTDLRVFQGLEIIGSDPYPDAVLVLGGGSMCSGTLVNKRAVVTAAHCYCRGVNEKVIVGLSSIQFEKVVQVDKNESTSFIACDAEDYTKKGDYAVLMLTEEVTIEPRRIATRDMVERSAFLRLVGFGRTQDDVVGRKFYVDAPIASYDCTGTIPGPRGVGRVSDQSFYGCTPDFEIVAGGLGRDTCNGDSGGPAYILGGDGRLYLAGATSRSVSGEVEPCGEGGIYPRVDEKFASWLENLGIDVEVGRP